MNERSIEGGFFSSLLLRFPNTQSTISPGQMIAPVTIAVAAASVGSAVAATKAAKKKTKSERSIAIRCRCRGGTMPPVVRRAVRGI